MSTKLTADPMSSYWLNFIKTGKPNGPGLPTWDTIGQAPDSVMRLNTREHGSTEEVPG
ncbi:carboxylesterase family protein [Gordonia sputi]|uniref:Carboxylesterase type B domain-containing protein n=1 Tax=Gordonia sputi NBRC 100414 TaxID=1089453 RepID=H5TVP5_9ACTN|nr:carboxylesterase family protein [Gordonia sputi]NKY96025.1 carboxylesterase family protein [Gordonia sputi]GAB37553.1 hypothetical protein GOSPT_015_00060 [Gordonia sputi NBRC 100414]